MPRVTISDETMRALEFIMEESYYGDKPMTNKQCDQYIDSIVELACKEYWDKWYKEYSGKHDNK